jgi:uncharacterized membrane protein
MRGLAIAYDDVVDINLKVWGGSWAVGLSRLRAWMALPARASGPRYRVFAHPETAQAVQSARAVTLHASSIPPRQFVELRVVVPRSLLQTTGGALTQRGNGLPRILREERKR